VPVPGGEPQLVKREAPREPLRVSGRHDAVTAAADEQHGGAGLGRVEAPGGDVGDVIDGDRGRVDGGGRHVPPGTARRFAVAGPVVGQPADPEPLGRLEQRLGRCADVPLPVQFSVSYQENGRTDTAQPPGFPDLGQVAYTGCKGSS